MNNSFEDRRFYVYVYLDPRKPGNYEYGPYHFDYEPFYVGKGCGNRLNNHITQAKNKKFKGHKVSKIRKLFKLGMYPIIYKFVENIGNDPALDLEYDMNLTIGDVFSKTGPLLNIDKTKGRSVIVKSRPGWSKGLNKYNNSSILRISLSLTGRKASEETRQKQRESSAISGLSWEEFYGEDEARRKRENLTIKLSGENNYIFGKTTKEVFGEDRAKEINSKRANKGEKNGMYGKPSPNKGKPSPSRGKHRTDETKSKISAATKGEKNPFYGKRHSSDTVRLIKNLQRKKCDIHSLIDLYFEGKSTKEISIILDVSFKMVACRLDFLGLFRENQSSQSKELKKIFIQNNLYNIKFYHDLGESEYAVI